jgi:hypothetical protein
MVKRDEPASIESDAAGNIGRPSSRHKRADFVDFARPAA